VQESFHPTLLMKISPTIACFAAVTACAPATRYLNKGIGPMTDPVASHTLSIAKGDLAGVDLRMRDGSARIMRGASDSITAKVELTRHSDRDYRGRCDPPAVNAANVSLRRVARTVDIRIESSTDLRCAEHWTITVPAGMNVVATGEVANISVSGITGDVIGTVDVGNLSITGAAASAIARVKSVGNASVESATTSYSEAKAEASVGKTELLLDGHRVDVKRAPGPGGRIAMRGSGTDRVIAETGVGDARVSIIRRPGSN
jgi:hypothetical protein